MKGLSEGEINFWVHSFQRPEAACDLPGCISPPFPAVIRLSLSTGEPSLGARYPASRAVRCDLRAQFSQTECEQTGTCFQDGAGRQEGVCLCRNPASILDPRLWANRAMAQRYVCRALQNLNRDPKSTQVAARPGRDEYLKCHCHLCYAVEPMVFS